MSPRRLTVLLGTAVLVVGACASDPKRSQATSPPILSSTTSSITEEMIGSRYAPMPLTTQATSESYGYSQDAAVKVGGGFGEGSHRTYGYLNALLGPKGERVHYTRVGTCCPFKTPNSPFEGQGLLEVYEVSYEGGSGPRRLYFNWYDDGDHLIPVGLTSRPH